MIRDYYAHVRFLGIAKKNFARAIKSAGGFFMRKELLHKKTLLSVWI